MTEDEANGDPPVASAGNRLAAELRCRRQAAGLSQRLLAEMSGYTAPYISMAEKVGGRPSRDLVRALDSVLGAEGALTTLWDLANSDRQALRESNRVGSGSTDSPSLPSFEPSHLADGLFAKREVHGTASIAAPLASQLQLVASVYRNAYSSVPASQLFGSAREHLNLIRSLHPGNQEAHTRNQLLTAAGEMAALAMPVLGLNLGRWSEAGRYLEISYRAARETENIDLESVVWACRAFHAAYGLKDLTSARDFADEAIRTAHSGATSTTRGWVAAVASERYADLGESKISLRYLEQARVEIGDPDGRSWSGMGVFDEAKIVAYEGGNYSRLRRPKDAVRVLDVALDSLDSSMVRHRCTAYIDRAEAQAASGHVDASCADAHNALTLAVETQHADTVRRTKQLARSLLPIGGMASRQLWQEALAAHAATIAEG